MPNSGVQSKTIRKTVTRLAQYRPFGDGQPQVEMARHALIVAAAHESGGTFGSLAECQNACQTLWGLRLDIDELRSALGALVATGVFEHQHGEYSLSDFEKVALANRIETERDRDRLALNEWETSIGVLYPDLTPIELAELRGDLVTWLQRMVVGHGVEAALVVYPEHERSAGFIEALAGFGFDDLPKREPRLDEIRKQAIHRFVSGPTAAQREYVLKLLNTAYMLAVYTIDPGASELVKGITKGQRVYLDTNVVYSLLNLEGPRKYMSAKRVVDASRALGYEIAVTPWTVQEMRASIKRARVKLARTTLPPRALAEIAAEACSDEAFVTAYWRKFHEIGADPDDFLDLHEQVEARLAEIGIDVVEQSCLAIERNEDAIAEQLGLMSIIPGGNLKAPKIQEHDVMHRLLITRLRGVAVRRFSNAGYWFLTRDGVLIPYAMERRGSEDELPFAMSLGAWANVVRSLSPKTDDFDQTLVDLMDTESARVQGSATLATLTRTLGRVQLLAEDSSEEIATRILLDAATMTRIESTPDSEKDQVIDEAITRTSTEMADQVEELTGQVATERSKREGAETHKEIVEGELHAAKEALLSSMANETTLERVSKHDQRVAEDELKSLQDELARIEGDRKETDRSHRSEIEELKISVETERSLRNESTERTRRIVRRSAAGLLAGFGLATCILPVFAGSLSSGWPLAFSITAGILLLLGATGLIFGWTKVGIAVAAIGLAVGLSTGIHELAPGDAPPASSVDPASVQAPQGPAVVRP